MNTFPKNARVLFTGDSITAQTRYTTLVKRHYDKYLPELNVKFAVGAVSGSSLTHAIRYFNDLVLPFKPTHATICYGINDCGLGWLDKEDEELKRAELLKRYENYKANLTKYLDMLIEHNITPILVTPAPYAEFMQVDSPSHKGGQRLSYEYAEVMRAEGKKRGIEVIDVHARMAELYMHETLYGADRVHPVDLGHFRMAEAILRHQGQEIDEFKPFEEILNEDEKLKQWRTTAFRIGRIYGMYVCVKPDLYDMPYEEQMEYTNEFVINRGYGTNNVQRDFSTEFVILKPREKQLWAKIEELNG